MKNLGIWTGTRKTGFINGKQEIEEWVSGVENTTGEMDTWIKENVKSKIFLKQNIQESGTLLLKNFRITEVEEE